MANYELSYIELYNTSRHGDLSNLSEKNKIIFKIIMC